MKSAIKLLLLIISLWSGCLSAAETKAAVETLQNVSVFAFGGVGFAGTTSEGEIAFQAIYSSKTAARDFAEVLQSGNPQAKCYALVGLRLKDRPAYDSQIQKFIQSKTEVQTCAGCIMAKLPMASVAANIQRGNYDKAAGHDSSPKR